MVKGFGYDLEHAGHFFADFAGGDARLVGSSQDLVRKVADDDRIIGRGFGQLFSHPFVEEVDAACLSRLNFGCRIMFPCMLAV